MRLSITLFAFLLLPLYVVHAQWLSLPGPNGGMVRAMGETANGTLLAAQHAGALHISTNIGLSWTIAADDLWTGGVNLLATAPDGTVFAGEYQGLYRSADGSSWDKTSLDDVPATIAFTASGDVLVGGTGRIHRSSNNGDNWSTITPVTASSRQFKLTVTGSGAWLAGAYQEGVVRSTDEGATWERVDGAFSNLEVYSLSTVDGSLLFAGLNNTTYRSTDDGVNWEEAAGLTGVNIYAVHRLSPTRLAAESSNGLYTSSDDGLNWSRSAADRIRERFVSMLVTKSGLIFAASDGGILRSTDQGSTWLRSDAGVRAPYINAIASTGTDHYFAGSLVSGLYRSPDAGQTWSIADSVYVPWHMRSVYVDSDGVIYGVIGDGGFMRSTDNGLGWETVTDSILRYISALTENESGLVASDSQGSVFASSDRGNTWQQLSVLQPVSGSVNLVTTMLTSPLDRNEIYAGTDRGLFRSLDGGETWTMWPVDLVQRILTALHMTSEGILYASTVRDLYRSTDQAASWDRVFRSSSSSLESDIVSNSKGNVFIADQDGLHFSADGVTSWETRELPGAVAALHVDSDGFLILGTIYRGMFRSSKTTVGTRVLPESATGLHISSIWPQPLRTGNTAMVEVSVRTPTQLTISVTDALGRTMLRTTDRSVDGGTQLMRLPITGLSPGAYMLHVSGNGRSVSRRFVVVR